jgi:hypothetical protein
MPVSILNELKEKAAGLTPEENLELIAHLVKNVKITPEVIIKRRRWREIYGKAPYPLAGEDAQTWVTRTRKEADESRGKH